MIVRDEGCPCCYGNGELYLITCPNCGLLVLACGEADTVFVILQRPVESSGEVNPVFNIIGRPMKICGDYCKGNCPRCHLVAFTAFRDATDAELRAEGFKPEEYV